MMSAEPPAVLSQVRLQSHGFLGNACAKSRDMKCWGWVSIRGGSGLENEVDLASQTPPQRLSAHFSRSRSPACPLCDSQPVQSLCSYVEGAVVRAMASRSVVPCRVVPSGISTRLVFVVFTSLAILPGGDSFLPGHLSAPSAEFVRQHRLEVCKGNGAGRCQRLRPTLPISLTFRRPRPFSGLFSLRGGGTAAEESVRDGEKKEPEKRLVPPGAVYGMGFGAITASRIAHVRPYPESRASRDWARVTFQ